MQLSASLERLLLALGVDAYRFPEDILVTAPFGEMAPDPDGLVRWLGVRCAEHADFTLAALAEHRIDPLGGRVLAETLRAIAKVDAPQAIEYANALSFEGPLEDTLHLGAMARVSALIAAGAEESDAELQAIAPLLSKARPVARHVAVWLGELGLGEGPPARRARAILEEALTNAVQASKEIAEDDAAIAQTTAAGRVIDLVAVLGTLAAHREGLTQRLSALAPESPTFVSPIYVVAYLTALGSAHRGPYLREVHHRLERAAADSLPQVRALAVEALGEPATTNPTLAAVVVESLTDADESVRTAAALAVAQIGETTDAAARELEDMIELGGNDAVLAAARAMGKCGREVPEHLLEEIDDPLVRATARVLAEAPGGDDRAFAALLEAYAETEDDDETVLDPRLQPEAVLVEALQTMSSADAARWMRRFANGERVDALGRVFYLALQDTDGVPREILEAGMPMLAMLARGEHARVPLATLVAARLWPDDVRLEGIIRDRAEPPISLLALGSLASLSEDVAAELLATAEQAHEEHGALALLAIGRCRLEPEMAEVVAGALVARLTDEDPLAEAAHAALLELVARGMISAV